MNFLIMNVISIHTLPRANLKMKSHNYHSFIVFFGRINYLLKIHCYAHQLGDSCPTITRRLLGLELCGGECKQA